MRARLMEAGADISGRQKEALADPDSDLESVGSLPAGSLALAANLPGAAGWCNGNTPASGARNLGFESLARSSNSPALTVLGVTFPPRWVVPVVCPGRVTLKPVCVRAPQTLPLQGFS